MLEPPLRTTSLDPPETNAHLHPRWSAEHDLRRSASCEFRHSGWQHDRQRVYNALIDADTPNSVLDEFAKCGDQAYVLESVDHPGVYKVAGSSCHQRWCLPCARARSHAIATNIQDQLKGKPTRFLTLTLRSHNESLHTLLHRITDSFAALRRQRIWRRRVTGGVAMIEVKWAKETHRWNVHIHAIIQGLYIDQARLTLAWKRITRDSYIIDIRFVKDQAKVISYVTKYASKPLSASVLRDHERLVEAIVAMKGKRLATTFGTWRGVLLVAEPDPKAWIHLGSLREMIELAETGDRKAAKICSILNVKIASTAKRIPTSRAPPASTSLNQRQLMFLEINRCIMLDPG